MCITQDKHLHCKMDGKDQIAHENIACMQFVAVLIIQTQIKMFHLEVVSGEG